MERAVAREVVSVAAVVVVPVVVVAAVTTPLPQRLKQKRQVKKQARGAAPQKTKQTRFCEEIENKTQTKAVTKILKNKSNL